MKRIAKVIAEYGIASRREAERMIEAGRVKINGTLLTQFAIDFDEKKDQLSIDNQIVSNKTDGLKLWVYYKPAGLVTTHKDEKNRPTVFDYLKKTGLKERVVSVGRLDMSSEGLLLLTNQGRVANFFENPANNIEREYKVRLIGSQQDLEKFLSGSVKGIRDKGELLKFKSAKLITKRAQGAANKWVNVMMTQGKNREIRRMAEKFNLQVNRLIRVRFHKFELGNLKPGEYMEVEYEGI